jgi:SAM-dependent methyltransferase
MMGKGNEPMDPDVTAALRASYDAVAEEYARQFFDELAHKPLDRALLDCFAEQVRGLGTVGELGCGPGQIARYLRERGVPMVGIDLSPQMVAIAQRLTPEIPFHQGTMLALDVADAAWGGIVAFYSIIHVPPDALPQVFGEFHRVLRAGGLALLSFHVGDERAHRDEWWGHPVSFDAQFYQPERIADLLELAGFSVEARLVRRPYAAVEHPSQRGYILARKP